MKGSLMLAVVVSIVGCAMPFSRPVPTESEYKQRFLTLLPAEQINDLRFFLSWCGWGVRRLSLASQLMRMRFSQIRSNANREDVYSPENGDMVQELRQRIALCAREGTHPRMVRFSLLKKTLAIFSDGGEDRDEKSFQSA